MDLSDIPNLELVTLGYSAGDQSKHHPSLLGHPQPALSTECCPSQQPGGKRSVPGNTQHGRQVIKRHARSGEADQCDGPVR